MNYLLQNNFKENVGMRPSARKIGVLITDGKSQDDVNINSQRLRDEGIELYAIGKIHFAHAMITMITDIAVMIVALFYVIIQVSRTLMRMN